MSNKQRQDYFKSLVHAVKGDRCSGCHGIFDPVCIDLHHTDPSTKVASVSWLVRHGTLEELKAELKKVVPLCAVCHRLVTYYGKL